MRNKESNPEFHDFLKGGSVDTTNKLLSFGQISSRQHPAQVTYRLPREQVEWLRTTVDGSMNYAVSQIMAYGIKALKERLGDGEFDIDHLMRPPED